MNFFLLTATLAGLTGPVDPAPAPAGDTKNLVETAVAAGTFETLAAALGAADLVDALQGEGPFTVFAPSDDAFAKLPAGTVERLLQPENKARLQAVLLYHVVPGAFPAAKVAGATSLDTLNGQRLVPAVAARGGAVSISGAGVVATDVRASNGVIHVIDTVLLPADKDIVDTAAEAGSFGTLLAAARAAGLVDALKGDGPLTVFAPTDEAFAKLPEGTVESLLKPENKERLKTILLYHVVSGRVYADQAAHLTAAPTLAGIDAPIANSRGKLSVAGAKVLSADLETSNGVIHVIDAVMLPSEKPAASR
ncbi:MAG: hypothetical protein DHS20C15_29750 [Planctomycetota bacterium]|nr:MAG: hypothetical protein DHS20C15_29750 [Planctomycetota bacterium]